MLERIIIAGAGGQGIMLLGKIIAQAACIEGREVTLLPAYGAEVRGGAAYCMVVLSDGQIGSPYITRADTLIAMNEPSLLKFKERLEKKGMVLANSSLISPQQLEEKNILKYPFSDLAGGLGDLRVANVVALGAYLAKKKIIRVQTVGQVIKDIAPAHKKDLIQINLKALDAGLGLIR